MAVGLVLSVVAGALVFESGSRGFFPLDQSNVFDGGYRMLIGQVPYRDFLMPVGPMAFAVQALFFRVAGVTYSAYLLHAAVVNALAALLAVVCVRRVFEDAVVVSWLAGLATAAWFYPPFGTPLFEQTAFVFHLLALIALLAVLVEDAPGPRRRLWPLAAGFSSALAFLSKQNAGALSAACGVLLILAVAGRDRWRLTARFAAGFGACAVLFAAWLVAFSDPRAFARHFLELPILEGMRRTTSAEFHATTAADLRSHGFTLFLVLLGPALGALGLAADLASRIVRKRAASSRASQAGFATAFTLGIFQWLFVAVTSNLPDNAFGLAGLADALALLACADLLRGRTSGATRGPEAGGWRLHAGRTLAAVLVLLPLSAAGRELARSRAVHEFWFEISYRRAPVSRALAPVAWSAPRDDPRALRVEDVDALVDFLRQDRAPFFVFPDFAVLYGLVGVRPPQPLVWFHRGLTYPARYDAALDRRVVAELEQASLRYVVVESVSFLGTEKRLRDFPLVRDYIETRFRPVRSFGIFEVRERERSR